MRITGSVSITLCAALTVGNDWPGQSDAKDTNSDRMADIAGIINSTKFWKSCQESCAESQEKAIEKHCKKKNS
jgi:hypothetical protein